MRSWIVAILDFCLAGFTVRCFVQPPDEEGAHEWEQRDNEEGEGRGGGEWSGERQTGPLVWEKSFRESFASVNDVLSVIADRETSPQGGDSRGSASGSGDDGRGLRLLRQQHTEGDSSSSWAAPRPSSPTSRRRVTAWGTPGSSQADVAPSTTYSSARAGQSGGPSATSPEGVPSRTRHQGAAGSSGGGSVATPFASSRGTAAAAGGTGWSGEGRASIEGAVAGVGGGGGFVESGRVEVSAEVSGMLQRYSEMMLRVMQVRNSPDKRCFFFYCVCL